VYPMELLALSRALRMAKFLDHPHSIVTDSQSSIDTVKSVLGESHLHFRNYSQAHITMGARGSLPAPHQVTIVKKVKSHVEKRKRDRHEWTQHEEGNVLGDVAASSAPDQLKKQ
jgi:ribonuclease HI